MTGVQTCALPISEETAEDDGAELHFAGDATDHGREQPEDYELAAMDDEDLRLARTEAAQHRTAVEVAAHVAVGRKPDGGKQEVSG